jgi:hypothetical protein
VIRLLLQSQPVIVHIEPPPSENASAVRDLTRVIVGSLGLTGAFVLVAVVVGLAIGAVLFWVRSRE